MNHLLNRSASSYNMSMTYSLSFFEDANHKGEIVGRISYVYPKGTSIMSQGDPRMIRGSWHRLCRINRARRSGRAYLHLIKGMTDRRERRVFGHLPTPSDILTERLSSTNNGYLFAPTGTDIQTARENPHLFRLRWNAFGRCSVYPIDLQPERSDSLF